MPVVATLGTDNLKTVIAELGSIVEVGVDAFKDGVQFTDVQYIPKCVGHVLVMLKAFPEALKEAKDLELDEIGELLGTLVGRVIRLLKYTKGQ